MSREQRKYKKEYKVQAVKLTKEIGVGKAAQEGRLDTGPGTHTLETAISLAEELAALHKQVKTQEREIRRLKEEDEFLAEASAFFAASRRKSARNSKRGL